MDRIVARVEPGGNQRPRTWMGDEPAALFDNRVETI